MLFIAFLPKSNGGWWRVDWFIWGGGDKPRLHFVRLLKQIQRRKVSAIIIKITCFIAVLSWKAKSCYFCCPARQCYCRAACWTCYESHCIPKRIIYLLVTYCRSLCCVRRIKSERREKKTIKESIMMNYFCALNKSTENEKSRVGETLATQRLTDAAWSIKLYAKLQAAFGGLDVSLTYGTFCAFLESKSWGGR